MTLLPFSSRKQSTSAWPLCAALKSGVVPDCTWSEGDIMESDGTDIQYSTSSAMQNWCMGTHTCYKQGVANVAGVSREVTKCIREAAKNVLQPCQWTSHQIHRISQGTPPWTTGPLGLPSARLCIQHHQSQRGGPSFWGQGTQQQQDGHKQHTSERHCVLSALNNRNRFICCSWTLLDVDTYVRTYIKCWRYHQNILASILTECACIDHHRHLSCWQSVVKWILL